MIEINKTKAVREATVQSLKAEIRSKMEQIDTLKLSMLKKEYELYALYSKLNDLDCETRPLEMQKSMIKLYSSEHNTNIADRIRQAGENFGIRHDDPVIA